MNVEKCNYKKELGENWLYEYVNREPKWTTGNYYSSCNLSLCKMLFFLISSFQCRRMIVFCLSDCINVVLSSHCVFYTLTKKPFLYVAQCLFVCVCVFTGIYLGPFGFIFIQYNLTLPMGLY